MAQPPVSARARLFRTMSARRPPRRLFGALLLAALLAATAGAPRPAAAAPLGFGDTALFAGCLAITALTYRGRQGDFDNHDWVTVQVENHCPVPLRHLEVELRLYDQQGGVYGRRIWLLGRRELLPPGQRHQERYAIPDPDNRIAQGWDVVVLKVERGDRRRTRR